MSRFTRVQKITIGCIIAFVLFGFIEMGMQSKGGMIDLGYDAFSMLRYGLIEKPMRSLQG